jgi:hypothetical protein
VLNTGVRVDPKYMIAVLDDLKDGQPDQRLVARRQYWASACGQVVKVLFALTNSHDDRVREHASWEQAIKQAEREIGRMQRGNRSSLSVQLRRFAPVLHFLGAFEIARDDRSRPPLTVEALLNNAMTLHTKLWDWHVRRRWRGARNQYLEGGDFLAVAGRRIRRQQRRSRYRDSIRPAGPLRPGRPPTKHR